MTDPTPIIEASDGLAEPMEALSLILGFLEALLWPGVVVALALYFKRPVSELIQRLTKLQVGPVSGEAPPRDQPETPVTANSPPELIDTGEIATGASDDSELTKSA
jgi:hypothetical protein